jgi:hypothetical protein
MTDKIPAQVVSEEQLLNLGIGSAEPSKTKLTAKDVLVMEVAIAPVKGSQGRPDWKKVVLSVKHPDKEELISISQVKIEKDKQIKISAMAVDLDQDGKLAKWGALAQTLKFYNIDGIAKLKGMNLKTAEDDKGYLVIKAY